MADENKQSSHSDELYKILDEYRSESKKPESAQDSGDLSRNYIEDGTDDALSILSAGKSATSDGALSFEPSPEETETEAEDNGIPEALFGHLSNEGQGVGEDIHAVSNPHFTDSFTPVDPPQTPEEPDGESDDDDDEQESRVGKVGRIFQRLSVVPKAVIYIVLVVLVSAYLSYYIISIGNDVFALVPPEVGSVEIEISEGATDEEVAEMLADNGVIEYGWVYKLYMRYRGSGDSSTEYIPGKHTINREYNYSQIITALTTNYVNREVLRVTIPEGYTVDQIIDLFVSNGLGTREKYVEAINEYPYKHEFVKLLDETGYPEERKYRLEGYLFPDTYDFYNTTSEVYVINTLLNTFNEKFWKDFVKKNSDGVSYQNMMEEDYGMTFDEIITLASMVQAEGKTAEDFEYISYVFHNRLSHKSTFPKLESDATIQYVLEKRETDSSQIDISLDSPYNTYLYDGLPPGAICNPGLDAFMSAMFPSAPQNSNGKDIDAYFFVSNNAGKTYYASGRNGHENNKAQVVKDNEAIENGTYDG